MLSCVLPLLLVLSPTSWAQTTCGVGSNCKNSLGVDVCTPCPDGKLTYFIRYFSPTLSCMYQSCRHHLQPVHKSGWQPWGLLLPVHRLPFNQSVLCCKCYTLTIYLLSTLYTGYNCLNCRVLDFLFPCQFHFTLSSQTTVTVILLLIMVTVTMNMSFIYYLS